MTDEVTCDSCRAPTTDPVRGYLCSGNVLCRPCWNYLDNEVFVYKGDD